MQVFPQVFSYECFGKKLFELYQKYKGLANGSRGSITLHLGFMELDLYFLTRILFNNNVHH